jgi:hypothetical protein
MEAKTMSEPRATSKGQLVDMAAVKIGEQYRLGVTNLAGSIKHLLKCGALLISKKAEFKHGEWGKWQEANASVLGFGKLTAQRLMKAAGKYVASEEFDDEKALEVSRELWGHEGSKKKKSKKAGSKKEVPTFSKAEAEVLGTDKSVDCDVVDILGAEWEASTWLCLPPAGSADVFMDKLCREIAEGRVSHAIALVPSHTHAKWFQDAVIFANAVCFIADHKLVACHFGGDADSFHDAFSVSGVVLRRIPNANQEKSS